MSEFVIETNRLSYNFGSLQAVCDLDLRVKKGTIYGFLGPNGAGKTTTIRLILGLIRAKRGSIRLFDSKLNTWRSTVFRQVGAMVESPSLYLHLTAYENLEITRKLKGVPKSDIDRVLDLVKMRENSNKLVRKFSHGMKQRIGLALALLGEPELLILDEPFNGLDPQGFRDLRTLILSLAEEGCTIFLSSHILSEIQQVAGYVGIINHGKLLYEGPIESLKDSGKLKIQIEVDNTEKALKILGDKEYNVEISNKNQLLLNVRDKPEAAEINTILIEKGILVYQLSYIQENLEEIFLDLTG
ncbi:ABC transporter ATP-binding protein [candidate division KSB1 bacterium]